MSNSRARKSERTFAEPLERAYTAMRFQPSRSKRRTSMWAEGQENSPRVVPSRTVYRRHLIADVFFGRILLGFA